MSNKTPTPQIVYRVQDVPPPLQSLLAAVQHILASLVGIVTPSLIVCSLLGLDQQLPYQIAMSLMISGVATFIQCRRIGPVGSGLMALQGTSFGFLGVILAAGFTIKQQGGGPDAILSMIFGLSLCGCLVEIILSQFITKMKRIITPTVTGIVITVIGLSLVKVGFTDFAGGHAALDAVNAGKPSNFGTPLTFLLGFIVVSVILFFTFSKVPVLRISAIMLGIIVGFIVAACFGMVNWHAMGEQPWITIPIPFKYGFSFDWSLFLPFAFIYLITAIETTGDLTANSVISGEPISGPVYMQRIKGGVLADGVNSAIAAIFCSLPNTTFAQNSGVIQMTGVASRHVGLWIASIMIILGFFPFIGSFFMLIPKPVLGGATLVLFGSIAVAGIRILASQPITHRSTYIMSISFGLGLGIVLLPEGISQMPDIIQKIFSSPVTTAGISAIVLSLIIPEKKPSLNPKASATAESHA